MSHFFLRERIKPGDLAVDATCGNGLDTQLLASLVGESGRVVALDLQECALTATGQRLAEAGLLQRVTLLQAGHEKLAAVLDGSPSAIVFNLGYLPGSDHLCRTTAATTVSALSQGAELLVSGGILTVAVYTGHPGGADEAQAVLDWASALSPYQFNVWRQSQLNRSVAAPYLVLIEKTG